VEANLSQLRAGPVFVDLKLHRSALLAMRQRFAKLARCRDL
jgi:hypothetical protein